MANISFIVAGVGLEIPIGFVATIRLLLTLPTPFLPYGRVSTKQTLSLQVARKMLSFPIKSFKWEQWVAPNRCACHVESGVEWRLLWGQHNSAVVVVERAWERAWKSKRDSKRGTEIHTHTHTHTDRQREKDRDSVGTGNDQFLLPPSLLPWRRVNERSWEKHQCYFIHIPSWGVDRKFSHNKMRPGE